MRTPSLQFYHYCNKTKKFRSLQPQNVCCLRFLTFTSSHRTQSLSMYSSSQILPPISRSSLHYDRLDLLFCSRLLYRKYKTWQLFLTVLLRQLERGSYISRKPHRPILLSATKVRTSSDHY